MKKVFVTLFFAIISMGVFAQVKDPISWKYEAVKKSANTYELVITATVPKPWHIYSQHTGKGGPIATKITLKANPLISASGKPKEIGKLEKTIDKNFGPAVEVQYYADQVRFVQTLTLKGNVKTNVSGSVNYMVCDDNQCLPPTTKSFDIKLQ